jgi:hypothetical protein
LATVASPTATASSAPIVSSFALQIVAPGLAIDGALLKGTGDTNSILPGLSSDRAYSSLPTLRFTFDSVTSLLGLSGAPSWTISFYSSTALQASLYLSPLYIVGPRFTPFIPATTKCSVDAKTLLLSCSNPSLTGAVVQPTFWASRGKLWLGTTGIDPDTKSLGTSVKVKVVY